MHLLTHRVSLQCVWYRNGEYGIFSNKCFEFSWKCDDTFTGLYARKFLKETGQTITLKVQPNYKATKKVLKAIYALSNFVKIFDVESSTSRKQFDLLSCLKFSFIFHIWTFLWQTHTSDHSITVRKCKCSCFSGLYNSINSNKESQTVKNWFLIFMRLVPFVTFSWNLLD